VSVLAVLETDYLLRTTTAVVTPVMLMASSCCCAACVQAVINSISSQAPAGQMHISGNTRSMMPLQAPRAALLLLHAGLFSSQCRFVCMVVV
jgi:hypothetical protein